MASVVAGVAAITTGIGCMPLPIPGARVAGIGLIAFGSTSFTYNSGEVIDSIFHANPIKSFAMSSGISEEDYHMVGNMSTLVSSAGASACSPYMSGGGLTKATPSTSKSVTSTPKTFLSEPVAGDNRGSMLNWLPNKVAANPKVMNWNEFQSASAGKYNKSGMSDTWKQYKGENGIVPKTTTGVHGNSLLNQSTNYGYALVDKNTANILKFGETLYPNTRYSQSYLDSNNAVMKVLESGSKDYIHNWQYDMNSYYKSKYLEFPSLNSKGW